MASAELSLDGGELSGELTTFTYTEAATPLTPDDSEGAVASFQAGVAEWDGSITVDAADVILNIDGNETLKGEITDPSSDGSVVSLSGASMLNRFNVTRVVSPFHGKLSDYLKQLAKACGIDVTFEFYSTYGNRIINAPGFHDNIWAQIKMLLAANGLEMADTGSTVKVRPLRLREIDTEEHPFTQTGWSSDSSSLAQKVEVVNYNAVYGTNVQVYPPAVYDEDAGVSSRVGWTTDTEVITAEPGQITTTKIQVEASLISVEQPQCVKSVGPDDGANGSVYTVSAQGRDDNGEYSLYEALDPDEWERRGGKVTVDIDDDSSTLIITVNPGNNLTTVGTFALAMPSDGDYYSSLRIRGTGIIYDKARRVYPTGLDETDTSTEVGTTIDTGFVGDPQTADAVGYTAQVGYAYPRISITGTLDDTGLEPGTIAGARLRHGDAYYRVTQAQTSQTGVQITAAADTTLEDVSNAWAGLTFQDVTKRLAGKTFRDFGATPLA